MQTTFLYKMGLNLFECNAILRSLQVCCWYQFQEHWSKKFSEYYLLQRNRDHAEKLARVAREEARSEQEQQNYTSELVL